EASGRYGRYIVRSRGLCRIQFGADFGAARIGQKPLRGRTDERPCGIGDHVANRPDNRCVEGPYPPARQRVVEFLDAVPLVSGRVHARDFVDLFLAHLSGSGLSSLRGMPAARSAEDLPPGRKAKITTPMKNRVIASSAQESANCRMA